VPSRFERGATAAFVVVTVAAGVVAAVAPIVLPGFVLGGSACGGGGSDQRCTAIVRHVSLVEASPRAWAFVAGGVLCLLLGAAVRLVPRGRARIALPLAVFALALAGLVQTTRIEEKLGPDGGTYGRTDADWGGFLSPTLVDLREDAVSRYDGTLTEPGGPPYDREQILDSFFVRAESGWRVLFVAVVVLFFAAAFEFVRRLIGRPALAAVTAVSAGLVIWGLVLDDASTCDPGASECYDGLPTALAVSASALVWGAYLAGVLIHRIVVRARRPGR